MTLTAREAMQALLDGKTLKCEYTDEYYKLDDTNLLHKNEKGWSVLDSEMLSYMDVYDEYSLTFEQALREMLNGKTVMCEVFNDREYLFSDGWFRFQYHDDNWIQADWFEMRMRDAKWKVVE